MSTFPQLFRIQRLIILVAALALTLGGVCVLAEEGTSPPAEPAAATTIDPEVRALLMDMAKFLAAANRFRVEIAVSYDAVQPTGQDIEFNEHRTLVVERPGRFRVDLEGSDAKRQQLVYDGKQILLTSLPANVYAVSAVSGTIDDAIKHFLGKLGMRLPLAAMLMSSFPAEFDSRLQDAKLVETTDVFGAAAHHIAGNVGDVDFQIWIADGAEPLPQRIVLTYKNSAGQPQFRAQFSAWDFAPKVDDTYFAVTPPAGAHPISFATELAQIAAIRPSAPSGENP